MTINNFKLLRDYLSFPDNEDTFYDVQVITRGKDHPELASKNHTIRSYYITSLEQYDKVQPEIISLCNLFQARAYINIAPKSISRTAQLQLKNLAERIYNGDYKKVWKTWSTCAGLQKSNLPRWVADIDSTDSEYISSIEEYINSLQPSGEKIILKVPTLNGVHLITSPFNLQDFHQQLPDIDVHKNNPTLLYIPEELVLKHKLQEIDDDGYSIELKPIWQDETTVDTFQTILETSNPNKYNIIVPGAYKTDTEAFNAAIEFYFNKIK